MERKCKKCQQTKDISEFYASKKGTYGHGYRCKECKKIDSVNQSSEQKRNSHYRRKYGISLADFNQMVLAQGSKCACCGTSEPRGLHNQWCVDHDHITGNVRELLCKDCNIVLGIVDDSPEHLQRLIEYVLKHSKHNQSINND